MSIIYQTAAVYRQEDALLFQAVNLRGMDNRGRSHWPGFVDAYNARYADDGTPIKQEPPEHVDANPYPLAHAHHLPGAVFSPHQPYHIDEQAGFDEEQVDQRVKMERLSPGLVEIAEQLRQQESASPETVAQPSSPALSEFERTLANIPLYRDQPVKAEPRSAVAEMAAHPSSPAMPDLALEDLLVNPSPKGAVQSESESELTEVLDQPASPVISEQELSLYDIPPYPGYPTNPRPRFPPVQRIRDIPARRGQRVPGRRASRSEPLRYRTPDRVTRRGQNLTFHQQFYRQQLLSHGWMFFQHQQREQQRQEQERRQQEHQLNLDQMQRA
ncbi:hypothetical protein IL306_000972 [Fusarium sp. DS 682]|nr:hypothetical protein IL306_000972 [Fusarium sp. DS 682]